MIRKFSVSMESELLDRIDAFAASNGLTRSGFLSFAATQYLQQQDLASDINKLCAALQKLGIDSDENLLSPN